MNSASAPGGKPEKQRTQIELDRRYGQIGISAVAAALRYQSDAKNPAYAPADPDEDKHLFEPAAA